MTPMRALIFSLAAVAALAITAVAMGQPIPPAPNSTTLDVKDINFDLWCQETQHLPPDRCDKRIPQDENDFEAYRSRVERYEVPYLQQKQDETAINRQIIHSDPLKNPVQHPQQPPAPNP